MSNYNRHTYICTPRSMTRSKRCECCCIIVAEIGCIGCRAIQWRQSRGMPPTAEGRETDRFGRENRVLARFVGVAL